jgi:hypothetical protein
MAFALRWTGGRRGECQIEHADLNRRVENAQRLIVSETCTKLLAIYWIDFAKLFEVINFAMQS